MDQLIPYRWQDCLGHLSRDLAEIVWAWLARRPGWMTFPRNLGSVVSILQRAK